MNIGVIGSIYVKQLIKAEPVPSQSATATAQILLTEAAGGAFRTALNLAKAGFSVVFAGRTGGKQFYNIQEPLQVKNGNSNTDKQKLLEDLYGCELRSSLEHAGIDCTHIYPDPYTHTGIIIILKENTETRRIVYSGANERISIPDIALFFEYTDTLVQPLSALIIIPDSLPAQTAAFAVQEASARNLPVFSEKGFMNTSKTLTNLSADKTEKILQAIRLATQDM